MRNDIMEQVLAIKASMDTAAGFLTDQQAARAPLLYPRWSADGVEYKVDDRVYYAPTERLYKVITAHTSQASWTPDATPALFNVIDVEHEGTKDDPIPAARSMEYVYGKYYSDAEDGNLYLCERQGATAGETITLHYMPHELVGQYFTLVETEEDE